MSTRYWNTGNPELLRETMPFNLVGDTSIYIYRDPLSPVRSCPQVIFLMASYSRVPRMQRFPGTCDFYDQNRHWLATLTKKQIPEA